MKLGVSHLLFVISLLCVVLGRHGDGLRTTSRGKRKTTEGVSPEQPPLTVLEVRRETVGPRIRLTVQYKAEEADVDILWEHMQETIDGVTNTRVGDAEDGVYETSIMLDGRELVEEKHKDDLYFHYHSWALAEVTLYASGYNESIKLSLSIDEEEDYVDRDIPELFLELEPAGDFVYEDGQDFTFKIKKQWDSQSLHGPNGEITTYLINPETGEVSMDIAYGFFGLVMTRFFREYDERTMIMGTSEYRTSGILSFAAYHYSIWPSLIVEIKKMKVVTLRPSSQNGPFPDDYVGFANLFGPESQLKDGHIELICKADVMCVLECQAVGVGITNVTMGVLKEDGTIEPLDNVKDMGPISPQYIHGKQIGVSFEAMPGKTEIIQCVAEKTDGTTETMEATLDPMTRVEIVEEMSGIELLNDPDDPSALNFSISCTVRGNPKPAMNFNIRTMPSRYMRYGVAPDEIIDHGNGTYTIVKYITYEMDERLRNYIENDQKFLSATCKALRYDVYYSYDQYDMSYPNGSK